MRRHFAALLLAVIPAAAAVPTQRAPQPENPTVKKLTPVLVVDRVESCAEFWTSRLGFTRTAEIPHGDALGFVILQKDSVEIMYQSRASVAADMPSLAEGAHRTVLYIEVSDLDQVERAMQGVEIVQPRRTTFYGMMEISVREPGGNLVVFAQPAAGSS